MKKIIIISVALFNFIMSYAQFQADAGPSKHSCPNDIDANAIPIGGAPSAIEGVAPYTYIWSIKPIDFVSGSTLPYLYTSNILNDTTIANPSILYRTASDSIVFYLTVTDATGAIRTDSCTVTFSNFGTHLGYFEYWISKGDSVYLDQACNIGGGYGNTIYEWHPSLGLSDSTLESGFWAKPDTSIAYTATITDSKGCRQTAGGPLYYVYVNTVNIPEIDLIPLEIFPNPTDGLIYFQSNNQQKIKMLKVYTSTGMKLISVNNPINVLDLSSYQSGMYIMEFYFDEGLVRQKIIKK